MRGDRTGSQRAVPRARARRARPRARRGSRSSATTPAELEAALARRARGGSLRRLGRARADARRPHGRAARARGAGLELVVDEELEARDRGHLAGGRRAPAAAVRRLRDGRHASRRRCPEGAVVARARRHGAGRRPRARRRRRRRPARARRRAAAALAARARDRAGAGACSRRRSRPSAACSASSARASRRSRARSRRRAATATGVEATICARDFEIHVDLFVEPGAEARADELGSALRGRARPAPVRRGRARRSRRSCSTSAARAGWTLGDRRVVHRRARRRAADVGSRARATSSSAPSSRTRTR